jgi:hypothetical protein
MLDEDMSRVKREKKTVAMRALPSSKRREAEVRTPFIHAFHVAPRGSRNRTIVAANVIIHLIEDKEFLRASTKVLSQE